jgi:hypothetical protein
MDEHGHQLRQEPDSVRTRRIVYTGLIALIAFAIGITWAISIEKAGAWGTILGGTPNAPLVGQREVGMVFQVPFGAEIAAQRATAARERLRRYGWVDPEHKVAHIPIERAMEIVLARGLK